MSSFYHTAKGVNYMFEEDDPWRRVCLDAFEDATLGRIDHLGVVYECDGTMHTVVDRWPNSEGVGDCVAWLNSVSGEKCVTGVIGEVCRTWQYEDYVFWRKCIASVLAWQRNGRISPGTIITADRFAAERVS